MDGGIASTIPRRDVIAALRSLVADLGIDAPSALIGHDIDKVPWFVLSETKATAAIAIGTWSAAKGPTGDGEVVDLVKGGDRSKRDGQPSEWHAEGSGGCGVAPVLPEGSSWVAVDSAPSLDRTSAVVRVLVNEIECTSGRDPRPYLNKPTIKETDDSVTISWTSKSLVLGPGEGANCVGTAPVSETVTLARPLGDRILLDGSSWPPHRVRTGD